MQLIRSKSVLEYKWHDVTFKIRAQATRGDQYDMHAAVIGETKIEDGRQITTKPGVLFPWLIERFVESWDGVTDGEGHAVPWSMNNLRDLPAEPGEDVIMILGSYIMNHVGITPTVEGEELKKA